MVATLLGIIVFVGWVKICNFQAIRKESLRREALERAAGMLDYMTTTNPPPAGAVPFTKYYTFTFTNNSYVIVEIVTNGMPIPQPMMTETNPIGYRLSCFRDANWNTIGNWPLNSRWAKIELFDRHSAVDPGRSFSTLSVLLAPN